jgi:hypothetical protein
MSRTSSTKSILLGGLGTLILALLTTTVPTYGAEAVGQGSDPNQPVESKPSTFPTRKDPGHLPVRPAPYSEMAPQASEPVDKGPGDTLRTAGILTTMVGVAALGAGVLYNLTYNELKNDLETGKVPFTRERQDNLDSNKLNARIGYGLGLVVLGAGATFYYLGWQKDRANLSSLAVAPLIAPGVVTLNLGGKF